MSHSTAEISEAARDPVPSIAGIPAAPIVRPPPGIAATGPLGWARQNLFASLPSTIVTLALGFLLIHWAVGFVGWAFVHAIWTVPVNGEIADTSSCRALSGSGACWAIVNVNYRLILFGRYPFDLQWRPAIVVALFIALYAISATRRFWRKELVTIWINTLVVIGYLMWGGDIAWLALALMLANYYLVLSMGKGAWPRIAGAVLLPLTLYLIGLGAIGTGWRLDYVPQDRWGGLPITLILATFGLAFAFPLAVLVALGRRSRAMPAVRLICILYVELIRGVPLISLLFMASVMFPLFLPEGYNPDLLLRAQVAVILFAGAYLAEVVRGGLQALPKGQYEAADALGLGYWHKTGLIILPQALRLVIPPLVNTFIGFFKDTSLVLIIGMFDLLAAGKLPLSNQIWQGFSNEIYLFLSAIYFAFCFVMARYSRGLERDLSRGVRR